MNKYFVAGGTCDTGERVVAGLCQRFGPDTITCLVRQTSQVAGLRNMSVNLVTGNVADKTTFKKYVDAETFYIDITGPKHYWRTVPHLIDMGVKRALFVSTTGIYSKFRAVTTEYLQSEAAIHESGIAFTIIRPSMIYGTDRDRNMTKLLRFLDKWPLFPVFGSGKYLMQPVYVQDLAEGILTAILREEVSRGKAYNLCGPSPLPYIDLLRECSKALGRKTEFLHIPTKIAEGMAAVGEMIPGFPITREQVMRISEDKCFDISLAQRELEYSPRSFAEGIGLEVELLRQKGMLTNRRI